MGQDKMNADRAAVYRILVFIGVAFNPHWLAAADWHTSSGQIDAPNAAQILQVPAASVSETRSTQTTAQNVEASSQVPRGNPLWAIPLSTLVATREAPIFSPSRRPPPVSQIPSIKPLPVPVAAQPARPLVSLVGVIAGNPDGIAILVDETTKGIVRLRTGESYTGWTLQTLQAREVTMQRNGQNAVVSFPGPSSK
jgi:general secretion pathway protein N